MFRKRTRYLELGGACGGIPGAVMVDQAQGGGEGGARGFEGDRSVSKEGIMPWRNVADARVKKEGEKRGAPRRMEKTEGGTA